MSNTTLVSSVPVAGGKDPKKFFARLYKGEKLPAVKQFRGLQPSGHSAEELICDCCGDGNDCCGFN